jgi:hypothetical protein
MLKSKLADRLEKQFGQLRSVVLDVAQISGNSIPGTVTTGLRDADNSPGYRAETH